MSIEIVKPVIEDGIEFYVSSDGSEAGVSISGLARLCGVDRKTIQTVLANKSAPKASKSSPEEVFNLRLEGFKGAKIINSRVATQIIKHYAYESKAANVTARYSLDRFIDIGFTSWVKQVAGFSVANNNHALTNVLNELYTNINHLTQEMREWRTVRRVADDHMEGVNILIEEINRSEEHKESVVNARTYTLIEWLEEEKGIAGMSHSNKTKLGRAASETYKSLRQYKPNRTTRMIRSRRTNCLMPNKTNGYTQDDFPILEVAYNEFMTR